MGVALCRKPSHSPDNAIAVYGGGVSQDHDADFRFIAARRLKVRGFHRYLPLIPNGGPFQLPGDALAQISGKKNAATTTAKDVYEKWHRTTTAKDVYEKWHRRSPQFGLTESRALSNCNSAPNQNHYLNGQLRLAPFFERENWKKGVYIEFNYQHRVAHSLTVGWSFSPKLRDFSR